MIVEDQLGRKVEIPKKIERIVSLVPSQTELLVDLGLREKLVGITRFCVHPKEVYKNVTCVGGTKDASFDRIAALMPDIVIANKEENSKELIEELQDYFSVWVSDVRDFDTAREMISKLGEIFLCDKTADDIINRIHTSWKGIEGVLNCTAAYLIWNSPMMLAGSGTFIDSIIEKIGLSNVTKAFDSRYPEMNIENLQLINPNLILLSSEPFPFKEKHLKEYKETFPNAKILLVDGEMFSWYGSRLIKAGKYMKKLLQELQED